MGDTIQATEASIMRTAAERLAEMENTMAEYRREVEKQRDIATKAIEHAKQMRDAVDAMKNTAGAFRKVRSDINKLKDLLLLGKIDQAKQLAVKLSGINI